ncbi:RodZ domain-containing protein [Desulfurispira natronophila]|uniref:Cytoskeletal protein RodZ n=1 Tax=Desulfurispira natronophila TaxID=682562 RepID=A0A7W8DGH5_9BACT|nr:RodZ domain-containing protein [Desulfurispira natronophila]MBB5021407.1 cytoskeletal protein RodZ [Desulfurispira natronophila]
MNQEDTAQDMQEQRGSETLGSYLRGLRDERAISVEELADRTKIAVSQIVAIENDQHNFLPPKAFVLGFIKSMCNELRGDYEKSKSLLNEVMGEPEAAESHSENVIATDTKRENAGDIINRNNSLSPYIFGAAVLVVAIAVIYFYTSSRSEIELATDTDRSYDVVSEVQQELREQQQAEEAARLEEQRRQQEELQRQRAEDEAQRQAELERLEQEEQTQAPAVEELDLPDIPYAESFTTEIPISVRLDGTGEAWVKMVGSYGNAMETTILQEGTSLHIDSVGTVVVALGNAGDVEVFVRDELHGVVGSVGQVRRFLVEPISEDDYRITQISRDEYLAILRHQDEVQ